ncbi:hypothetical protein IKF15_03025 [Candidatus Saccharibacteria bacterium]|nr:hypothetical protein [Candidatus Saccharibacteria bacterium]
MDRQKSEIVEKDRKGGKGGKKKYVIVAVLLAVAAAMVVAGFCMNKMSEERMRGIRPSPSAPRHSTPGQIEKPMIYLYPEKEMEVAVKLGSPEKITVDYPDYADGWKVVAKPNGDLREVGTGRELYALYYEAHGERKERTKEGFVVAKDEVESFLEEKLEILGLNYKEKEEFMTYWIPKMEAEPYVYVRFLSLEEIEKEMALIVSPAPETMIRILMVFEGLSEREVGRAKKGLVEQKLEVAPERRGFTVVEWGGSEL